MPAQLDPLAPIVVASSTDLGYVTYLLSQTPAYRGWSVERAMQLLLPALRQQQLRVYCDLSGAPIACAAWAFVGAAQEATLRAGQPLSEAADWKSGDRAWIVLLAAPFGHARAVLRELRRTVFVHSDAVNRRVGAPAGRPARLRRWLNRTPGRDTGAPRTADAVIGEVWGRGTGYFASGAESLGEAMAAMTGRIAEHLAPRHGDRVVDLGCRRGELAIELVRRHGCEALGVDPLAERVHAACANSRNAGARFEMAALAALPHAAGSFQAAVANESPNHVDDATALLREANRVLAPDGRLLLGVFESRDGGDAGDLLSVTGLTLLPDAAAWDAEIEDAGFSVVGAEDLTQHLRRTYQGAIDRIANRFDPGERTVAAAVERLQAGIRAIDAGRLGRRNLLLQKRRGVAVAAPPAPAMPERKTTLVMLSGGLDSVYALYQLLTTTDDDILAHHINFVNDERRHVVESSRCRRIVAFLRETVRDFAYTETTIDHRQLPFYGYDTLAVGFEAGCVAHGHLLRHNRRVDRWTAGVCSEDSSWSSRFRHTLACVAANSYPFDPPEFYELPTVSKQAEIDAMPPELVAMCWGCRRPLLTDAGYRPCGKCHTCRILQRTTAAELAAAAAE